MEKSSVPGHPASVTIEIMTERWKTVTASEVKVGDRVRVNGDELTATHIADSFLDREGYLAFIEDTSERWHKRPAKVDAEVEVLET